MASNRSVDNADVQNNTAHQQLNRPAVLPTLEPNVNATGYVYPEQGIRPLPTLRTTWPFAEHYGENITSKDGRFSSTRPLDGNWTLPSFEQAVGIWANPAQLRQQQGASVVRTALDQQAAATVLMSLREPSPLDFNAAHRQATESSLLDNPSRRLLPYPNPDVRSLEEETATVRAAIDNLHTLHQEAFANFNHITEQPASIVAPTPRFLGNLLGHIEANVSVVEVQLANLEQSLLNSGHPAGFENHMAEQELPTPPDSAKENDAIASDYVAADTQRMFITPGGTVMTNPWVLPTAHADFQPEIRNTALPEFNTEHHQIFAQAQGGHSVIPTLATPRTSDQFAVNNQLVANFESRHCRRLDQARRKSTKIGCYDKRTHDEYLDSIRDTGELPIPGEEKPGYVTDLITRDVRKRRKLDDMYPRASDDEVKAHRRAYYAKLRAEREEACDTSDSGYSSNARESEVDLDAPCVPAGYIRDPVTGILIEKKSSMVYGDEVLARKHFRYKWNRWRQSKLPATLKPVDYEEGDSGFELSGWEEEKKERRRKRKMEMVDEFQRRMRREMWNRRRGL